MVVGAEAKPQRRDGRNVAARWRKLGLVIAERRFELAAGTKPVVLRIAAPRRHSKDWACRFSIEGLANNEIIRREAYGVDSVQALVLCLEMVKMELHALSARSGMTWLGIPTSADDLGLMKRQ